MKVNFIKFGFRFCTAFLILWLLPLKAAQSAERQVLQGHVPGDVARLHLQPTGRLASTNRLHLAIGLPLRNKEALGNLLQQISDPASPQYRHYLTSKEFTQRFGPSEEDYQSVIAFAKTNGLTVTETYPHRMLVSLNAAVVDIERALHVTLYVYRHPTERREFYALDAEPSLDLAVPVLHISGMDDYHLAHPDNVVKPKHGTGVKPNVGTGPSQFYMGNDFRNAYVPDVSLTGSGQTVGLLEFDGYTESEITWYEDNAKPPLPHVPLIAVTIDGAPGTPSGLPADNPGEDEVTGDIEMLVSMAPGLSSIVVYTAPRYYLLNWGHEDWDGILARMVEDTYVNQFSCSWGTSNYHDPNADQFFLKMRGPGTIIFPSYRRHGCIYRNDSISL